MNFPEEWPECCPPDDAVDADGMVFAAAKSNPYSDQDFTSAHERKAFFGKDECQRRGVSVMTELSDAEALLERFRRKFRHVAQATLSSAHGRIKETPRDYARSHCTFWPCVEVNLKEVFEVIQ